jgi:hypothetical protein
LGAGHIDWNRYPALAISARFIADMQEHWEKNGMSALDEVRQKFPDRYVDNYIMLSRVIRLEADVKHSLATPKTVDEALAELESKVGKDGSRKFEKFLREVAPARYALHLRNRLSMQWINFRSQMLKFCGVRRLQ